MANVGHRISDLMLLLEDVAFGRKDVRLAGFLLKNVTTNGDVVEFTHKQVAVELGTAREVVSRLIKDFERKGVVSLARNRIIVQDIDLLHNIADRDK